MKRENSMKRLSMVCALSLLLMGMVAGSTAALRSPAHIISAGSLLWAASGLSDACSLLSQSRVSAVLGVSIGSGEYPGGSSPFTGQPNRLLCQWSQPGNSFGGKRVRLDLFGPIGKLTPVERFNNAKTPVQGIVKTPISGVGDDAYYIVSGLNTSLYVKKGGSVFDIVVFGFPEDQIKAMEKTLAQDVLAKL
jgi:hypothetical protein